MTNLATFWRNHRLGLLYGALWSLTPMIILEQIPLSNYYNGPHDFKHLTFQWDNCLVMLAASLPTGVFVTSLFRKLLKDRTAKALFLWGPLALLIGTALYGLLYAQLAWTMLRTTEPWGQLTLGSVIMHPAMAFFSVFAIVLIPLAALNTWHLWRRVNPRAI
jgi:hypothetical protein